MAFARLRLAGLVAAAIALRASASNPTPDTVAALYAPHGDAPTGFFTPWLPPRELSALVARAGLDPQRVRTLAVGEVWAAPPAPATIQAGNL